MADEFSGVVVMVLCLFCQVGGVPVLASSFPDRENSHRQEWLCILHTCFRQPREETQFVQEMWYLLRRKEISLARSLAASHQEALFNKKRVL